MHISFKIFLSTIIPKENDSVFHLIHCFETLSIHECRNLQINIDKIWDPGGDCAETAKRV